MSEWTEQDRTRIALYKQGYSLRMIARISYSTVAEVQESVDKLLALLEEKEVVD